jgi:dynein heavy chain, axonemal
LQPKLKQAAIDTEVKMKEVQENKASADVLKEGIEAEEKIVKEAVDAANKIKYECEADLAEAMPALKQAEDALKVLDKKQLDLLKAMKKPPNVIRVVMKALCLIMYPNPTEKVKNAETLKMEVDWWAASMKLLGNSKLLDELLEFKIDNCDESIINNLGKYLNDPENVPNLKIDVVENASTACKCMIMWINGNYNFYFVNKKVKPKKAALASAEAEVKQLSAKLAEKQKHLKAAVDKVTALNDELQSTIRYKEKLEKEYEECSKQLERAVKLIDSLGG